MGALFLAYLKRVDVNECRVKSYAILSLQTRKPIFFYFSKILILLAETIYINFLISPISPQWAKNKGNQFFKTLITQCSIAVALKMGTTWRHSHPLPLKGHNSSLAPFKDYLRL